MSYMHQKIADLVKWDLPDMAGRDEQARELATKIMRELGLVQFYGVAYGDGGQSEECYEHWDQARDMAEEADDAGYPNTSIVTAWFTVWEPATEPAEQPT